MPHLAGPSLKFSLVYSNANAIRAVKECALGSVLRLICMSAPRMLSDPLNDAHVSLLNVNSFSKEGQILSGAEWVSFAQWQYHSQ